MPIFLPTYNTLLNAVWVCDDIAQIHVCSTDLSAEPHKATTAHLKDAFPGKVGMVQARDAQVRRKFKGLFSEERTLMQFSGQAI